MHPSRFPSEVAFSHVDSWFLSGISYFLCVLFFFCCYWCACAIRVRVWQVQLCYGCAYRGQRTASHGWSLPMYGLPGIKVITKFDWRAFLPPEPSHRWCVGFETRVSCSLGWATAHHVVEDNFVLLRLPPCPAECWDCRHASPCWARIFQS